MKVSVNIKVKSNVKRIIWCLMFMSMLIQTEAGSCREASLCCNGRDSSCVVQKTPINVINEDPNVKPCYCDHACLKLGDCCEDFKSHCGGKWSCLEFFFIDFVMSFPCQPWSGKEILFNFKRFFFHFWYFWWKMKFFSWKIQAQFKSSSSLTCLAFGFIFRVTELDCWTEGWEEMGWEIKRIW